MLGIYCRTSKEADFEKSTIIQQRTIGIAFAEKHKFEYELYEDEGVSGFKISDDEQDPFNNRPAFTNLISDIKNGKIDKVWVWEHSRISRNQYASAFIFNIFEKYKITLYENQKEFKSDDPQFKFMRQMLDAVAEYERQLIVARTTRGKRKSVDEGRKSHSCLYGYEKAGKDERGYRLWNPVESELNNYRYMLKRYKEGSSLINICSELLEMNKIDLQFHISYSSQLGKILRKYQYTGYQLTNEGYDIFKRFRKNEIESINILVDRKYWIKSQHFPIELITIEDWVNVCEKLQIQGRQWVKERKERSLRANKDIATGLMECGNCGQKFYYQMQRKQLSNTTKEYFKYFHIMKIGANKCNQTPRSFHLEDINEIIKYFYFYFKVVFDNKNELIKESLRNTKQTQLKLKERIMKKEKEILSILKRLDKFQNRLKSPDFSDDLLDVLLRNIQLTENELEESNIELSKLKIDYELENDKFNQSKLEMTYYDVKEQINDWFHKLNVEEQRNELISMIKTCKIYSHYLIIDTGNIAFLFNINDHHVFDMNLLENLNKDDIYKTHFITGEFDKEVRNIYRTRIINIKLNSDEKFIKTFTYLKEQFNIIYDISNLKNFVSFVNHRRLLEIEKKKPYFNWDSQEDIDNYVEAVNLQYEREKLQNEE